VKFYIYPNLRFNTTTTNTTTSTSATEQSFHK